MKSLRTIRRFLEFEPLETSVAKLPRQNKFMPNNLALRVYRQALKLSSEFTWTDHQGRLWQDVLRKKAREEFELSREEIDPFVVNQMILTAQEAMMLLREKLNAKQFQLQQEIANQDFNHLKTN